MDDRFEETREWFREAGLLFPMAVSGSLLSEADLDWFSENGMGVIAPRSDYYLNMKHDAIWGIDLRDEPPASDFPALQERVQELYAQDPNRFPMINLLPMYASGEQLGEDDELPGFIGDSPFDSFCERAVRYRMHVSDYIGTVDSDIISADIYPLYVYNNGELGTYMHWMRNLDILAEAKRAKAIIEAMKGDAKIDTFFRYAEAIDERILRLSKK
ncbi:MAG: hypothetical protein IJS90_01890 [Clostridia bacterium]|nr:hypothetical protein [Clostridia bacterium]